MGRRNHCRGSRGTRWEEEKEPEEKEGSKEGRKEGGKEGRNEQSNQLELDWSQALWHRTDRGRCRRLWERDFVVKIVHARSSRRNGVVRVGALPNIPSAPRASVLCELRDPHHRVYT